VRLTLEDESLWSWFRHAQSLETPAMSSVMQTCQNNLSFSLCAVPSVCCVITTSDEGEKV